MIDPTQTTVLRKRTARRFRAELYEVGTLVEGWFGDESNWLGGLPTINVEPTVNVWKTSPVSVLGKFKEWFDSLLGRKKPGARPMDAGLIEGYERGDAKILGKTFNPIGGDLPVPLQKAIKASSKSTTPTLALLRANALNSVVGASDRMKAALYARLTEGIVKGENPKKVGRELHKMWRKLSKVSATRIARTETMRAFNEGALDRMEMMGVKLIGVNVEVNVVMLPDGSVEQRVCPRCRPLNKLVLTIEQARGLLPVHPNCRCAFIPAVDKKTDSKKKLRAALAASIA